MVFRSKGSEGSSGSFSSFGFHGLLDPWGLLDLEGLFGSMRSLWSLGTFVSSGSVWSF